LFEGVTAVAVLVAAVLVAAVRTGVNVVVALAEHPPGAIHAVRVERPPEIVDQMAKPISIPQPPTLIPCLSLSQRSPMASAAR
jgi:hypothetical protein